MIGWRDRSRLHRFPAHARIHVARINTKFWRHDDMKARVIFANEFRGLIRPIISRELDRPGLEVQPDAGFNEFFAGPIVMRIKGELKEFDIVLDEAGVFEFAQLPGVSEPG